MFFKKSVAFLAVCLTFWGAFAMPSGSTSPASPLERRAKATVYTKCTKANNVALTFVRRHFALPLLLTDTARLGRRSMDLPERYRQQLRCCWREGHIFLQSVLSALLCSLILMVFSRWEKLYVSFHSGHVCLSNCFGIDGCIYDTDQAKRVKYAYDHGHQVASHTWAHKNLATLTWDQSESKKTLLIECIH